MRPKLVSEINVARPPVSAGCETVTLTGHLLGYARFSTVDQQPRLKVDALRAAGGASDRTSDGKVRGSADHRGSALVDQGTTSASPAQPSSRRRDTYSPR
jgi:hypothetical protein